MLARPTATRGFYPEPPTLHTTSLQRVRWAFYGNVCSIASMLVSGHKPVNYADNVVYVLRGLHPQPKWRRVSTFVDSTAAHSLARGTGCGRPLGDLEFGTYFPAG